MTGPFYSSITPATEPRPGDGHARMSDFHPVATCGRRMPWHPWRPCDTSAGHCSGVLLFSFRSDAWLRRMQSASSPVGH